ncbi:uncharacterized protein A4U43_C10F4710 [Asparagus officinalis]|uniref:Leucine-rich repeat-containing N-terminal plant-type domain-containing protein n=1 Tax=Asparagus officinalis TaxID=4686 RepID=A0A5P1E3Y8_ASPOF|nr:polygalacturonase inhibitor-like [Asparagus officinalis]ONK56155.1 uncharacterized protein A4U43_C10F4710 [Asparagus officinalis]
MSRFFVLALVLILTAALSSACNQQDLTALLAIKSSFPPNSLPNSWTASIDCCAWDYIECDDTTGRVITLSISDNKYIKGSIPSSVTKLSALQTLSFSNLPGLSGSIPTFIAQLPTLSSIQFSQLPGLTGQIPSQLSKLTGLQFFTIYKTKLSGPIPSFLSAFTGLKELEIAGNSFVGTIPSSIGNLVNLTSIDLSSNQLTGAIPDSLFSKLRGSLADLDLSGNTLKGPIPKSFANIDFTNINLGSNQLDGDASFLFGESKTVNQIILSKNKFAFDLTNVKYSQNLQYLDMSHNKIFGSISNEITNLTNLGYLDVSYNELCGRIPSGGSFRQFDAMFFANNKCLCGAPLPPCK